jgi:hypothetical protein
MGQVGRLAVVNLLDPLLSRLVDFVNPGLIVVIPGNEVLNMSVYFGLELARVVGYFQSVTA